LLQASCQRLQQTVRTILSEVNPSHVVAVFDGDSPSWRHQLYPAYKAGRSPMPPELANGMEQLQDSLWQCGVDSLLSEGDEADDLVATLNHKLAGHQQEVTLISTDKGFCQLLDSGIHIRDYFNRRWLDHAFVEQEYGLPASSLVTSGPSPVSPAATSPASVASAPKALRPCSNNMVHSTPFSP